MYAARDPLLCLQRLKNQGCAGSAYDLKRLAVMISPPILLCPAYLHVLRAFAPGWPAIVAASIHAALEHATVKKWHNGSHSRRVLTLSNYRNILVVFS